METSSDLILGSDLSRTVVGSKSWSSRITRSIREITFRICAAARFGACGGGGEWRLAIDYLISGLNLPQHVTDTVVFSDARRDTDATPRSTEIQQCIEISAVSPKRLVFSRSPCREHVAWGCRASS